MQGPQGEMKWVPESQVDQARSAKFAVLPQEGTQRMATPNGQLTYALPSEVEKFKASGHVPIQDDGNFRVDPIPGESNVDTMKRAATIANNLPPDVMKQAIDAEKKNLPKRAIASLAAVPVVTAGTTSALLGGAEAVGAAGEAMSALPEMDYFMSSPRLYAEYLLKSPAAAELGKTALKYAVKGGAAALGFKYLAKFL